MVLLLEKVVDLLESCVSLVLSGACGLVALQKRRPDRYHS